MVLTGFRALSIYLDLLPSDYDRLQKSDYDVICTMREFQELYKSFGDDVLSSKPSFPTKYFIKTSKGNYDISILNTSDSSNSLIYEHDLHRESKTQIKDPFGNFFRVPDLEILYYIKKSHLFMRKNFRKHMEDFHRIDNMGSNDEMAIWRDDYRLIYNKRLEETLIRGAKATAHINLNQTKDEFFNTKGVSYTLDHDDIHKSIMLGERPAYLDILVPGEDVMCSKELWEGLNYQRQLECVIEEACVIAIERFLSKGKKIKPYDAFLIGLEKICTTLCRGYFRKFACMNYINVLRAYPPDFYDRFQIALKAGDIKTYTKLDER